MNLQEIKRQACRAIDEQREKLISLGRQFLQTPELGYKEWKTSALVEQTLRALGLEPETGLALTGVRARLGNHPGGPTVCVIGELDAVICPSHPHADPNTGAAHACGHNAQLISMLGAAIGLTAVVDALGGNVVFLAVPAEEYVELGYRAELARQGKLRYYSGKQELIRLGVFDDVDMAMMIHAQASGAEPTISIGGSSLGAVAKTITFYGKEAHAGAAPFDGVNALNAAMAALMCIHAQRERFRDEDHIRVHPIITKGGALVNVVPAEVTMETYVRGANLPAMQNAAELVDRAIQGAAYAIGARAKIENMPGYLPLHQDEALTRVLQSNAEELLPAGSIVTGVDLAGSTDMGDLSALMPCLHPTMGGFEGGAHSTEFRVTSEESAYLLPAKLMATTVIDLLFGQAEKAKEIKKGFKPLLTKEAYLQAMDDMFQTVE